MPHKEIAAFTLGFLAGAVIMMYALCYLHIQSEKRYIKRKQKELCKN